MARSHPNLYALTLAVKFGSWALNMAFRLIVLRGGHVSTPWPITSGCGAAAIGQTTTPFSRWWEPSVFRLLSGTGSWDVTGIADGQPCAGTRCSLAVWLLPLIRQPSLLTSMCFGAATGVSGVLVVVWCSSNRQAPGSRLFRMVPSHITPGPRYKSTYLTVETRPGRPQAPSTPPPNAYPEAVGRTVG